MGSLLEFKVILVGQSGVGKTSLIQRFAKNKFHEEGTKATIGFDIDTLALEINGKECLLHIHDTAGQETYWSLGANFFRDAAGVILVYSETSTDSFSQLSAWLENIDKYCGTEIIKIIAGNKADDKEKKLVIESRIRDFEQRENLEVIKTSAKTDMNVKEIFLHLIKKIAISKGIAEESTDPIIEILARPDDLLTAIQNSKADFVKEQRSKFVAKHLQGLEGARFVRVRNAPADVQDVPSEQNKGGCSC